MQTQVMHTGRALTPGQRWASRVTCAVLVSLWTHDVPTHTTDGLRRASPLWKAAAISTFSFPAQPSHGRHGGKWGSPNPPLGLIGASCQESVPRPAMLREHQPTRTKQVGMQQEFSEPLLDTQAHASKKGMGKTAYTEYPLRWETNTLGDTCLGLATAQGTLAVLLFSQLTCRLRQRCQKGGLHSCEHHRGVA